MSAEEYGFLAVANGELEIDADGHCWRVAARRGLRSGGTRVVPCPRRLAEWMGSAGYYITHVMYDWKQWTIQVHRLVWRVVVGPIPDDMQINHKNGVKTDNRPSNLEVVTPRQNTSHAYATGLATVREEHPDTRTVSSEVVREIRDLYATGQYTLAQLGQRFQVSQGYAGELVRGERRRFQGGPTSLDNRRPIVHRDAATGRIRRST